MHKNTITKHLSGCPIRRLKSLVYFSHQSLLGMVLCLRKVSRWFKSVIRFISPIEEGVNIRRGGHECLFWQWQVRFSYGNCPPLYMFVFCDSGNLGSATCLC